MTDEAVENQQAIVDWIAERSIDGALRWLDALEAAVESLGVDPMSHSLAPENGLCKRELRNVFFGTPKGRLFRAIFYVDEEVVVVTHLRGPGEPTLSDFEFQDN